MADLLMDLVADLDLIPPTHRELLVSFVFESMEVAVNKYPKNGFDMADLVNILGDIEVKTAFLFRDYTDSIAYLGQYAKIDGIEASVTFDGRGNADFSNIHSCIRTLYQQNKPPKFREIAEIFVIVRQLLSQTFVPLTEQVVRQTVDWTLRLLDDAFQIMTLGGWKGFLAFNHPAKSIVKTNNTQPADAARTTDAQAASCSSETAPTPSADGQQVDILQQIVDLSSLTAELTEHDTAPAHAAQARLPWVPEGAKPFVGCTCGAIGELIYMDDSVSKCRVCIRYQCLDCGEDFKSTNGAIGHRSCTKTHLDGTAFITTQHPNHLNTENQATGPPLSSEIQTFACGDQCPGTKADNYKINQYMSKCKLCSKIRCLVCAFKHKVRSNTEKHVTIKHKLNWLLPVDQGAILQNVKLCASLCNDHMYSAIQ